MTRGFVRAGLSALALAALSACASTSGTAEQGSSQAQQARPEQHFEADREAILAMAGEYEVTFDFTEFLPIAPGYELADPKITPAREVVYVIEDTGEFISLQHLLLARTEDASFVIKHWRQDWQYEPDRMLAYQGFNRWNVEEISPGEARGAWSQTVYQVDDSPRYAGLGQWEHARHASTWEPPVSWRPLPRRDATTRDDYDVIAAVNRHTVTEWGWSHGQDNSKLVLREGEPFELVREHGINTYRRADLEGDEDAAAYWDNTRDYWTRVRDAWDTIIANSATISVQDDAEGTLLYGPLLSAAQNVHFDLTSTEEAWAEAVSLMEARITADGDAVDID